MPRHQHYTEREAFSEAERLAKANKSQKFFVLMCIGGKTTNDVHDIEIQDNDIPF